MKNDKELTWKLVDTEHVVTDRWIDFRRLSYEMPDGTLFEPFYNYSRRSYVVIAATDTQGNYICVRQYRQGIGAVTTEFPAGGIENYGKTDYEKTGREEDPLEAARRELAEETGYTSDDWTHLLTIPSDATLGDNYAHLYLARNCRKVQGQTLDETEFVNVTVLGPEELEAMAENGRFQQAIHVLALMLAKQVR